MFGMTNSRSIIGRVVQHNGAVIDVIAGYGSTVSATNGNVIKNMPSYMMYSDSNNTKSECFIYINFTEFGSWTITVILNNTSNTSTITVSENEYIKVDLT